MTLSTRFKCKQIKDNCLKCGDCCRRYPLNISPCDEILLKKQVYHKKGILYIYPFERFGLPLKPCEVKEFTKLATKRNLKFSFKPLKVIIKGGIPKIIDYFLDMDVCPFLVNNKCTIYKTRFFVCRAYFCLFFL